MGQIIKAIILNEPYAQLVKEGKKLIETRMRRFKHRGDLVICCDKGKSKDSPNAGKALCIVNLWKVRMMRDSDEQAACIENAYKRFAYLLKDWRHFSEDFIFQDYAKTKNWQGIFDLEMPDHIQIISRPDIIPFREYLSTSEAFTMLKEDGQFDYLNFEENAETKKWDVFIGDRKDNPIEIFEDFDAANDFVNKVHDRVNATRSASRLRSLFN